MSTKSSLVWSDDPDFHFYTECLDDGAVYLRLCGSACNGFEVTANGITVRIPIEIWEAIRFHGHADVELADWTDAQVEEYVVGEVTARIAAYAESLEESTGQSTLLRVCGSMAFGMADDHCERQIAAGMEYFLRVRDEQTARKRRIKAIRAKMEERS